MIPSPVIWEALVRSEREVVTLPEVAALARRLGKRPEHALRHLRRARYLVLLFKGHYYVRSAEEWRLGTSRHNPLELFALAARAKGIGPWYYGLHTALRLNGMTHEDPGQETVVTQALYRIHGVAIGVRRFIIHRWAPGLLRFGLVDAGRYRHSDPEKTVLDLAYWDEWRVRRGRPATRVWMDHVPSVEGARIRDYLPRYPAGVVRAVEAVL